MRWRGALEHGFVGIRPDLVGPRTAIEAAASHARVARDKPAVGSPRQNKREHNPRVVGLPTGGSGQLIAPGHEDAARAPITQRRQWEVPEGAFDQLDFGRRSPCVSGSQTAKVLRALVTLEHCQEHASRRRHLARYRLVVGRDEFGRTWISAKRRAALPGVPIGFPAAVGEPLGELLMPLRRTRMAGHPVVQGAGCGLRFRCRGVVMMIRPVVGSGSTCLRHPAHADFARSALDVDQSKRCTPVSLRRGAGERGPAARTGPSSRANAFGAPACADHWRHR